MIADNTIPPVLINSIPKAGTHLMASVLDSFGLRKRRIVLERNLRNHPINILFFNFPQTCLVGLGQPQLIKFQTLKLLFKLTPRGNYRLGHLSFQPEIAELLDKLRFKTIFAIRDPRDIVVSQIFFYLKNPTHYLYPYYNSVNTNSERLTLAIKGIHHEGRWISNGIAKKFQLSLDWIRRPDVLTIRFEDIIGPLGGGLATQQMEAIIKIADHLKIILDPENAQRIGNQSFGRGATYRSGQIGSWKTLFDSRLKELFIKETGNLLIELGYETNQNWQVRQ